MEDDLNEEPSKLRERLSELGGQNKQMAAELAQYKAGDVIVTQGYMYVQPEDLADVPLEQLEERAAALETERATVFEGVVRRQLTAAGVEDGDLDKRVSEFLASDRPAGADRERSEDADAFRRARSMGPGGAPPARNPDSMSTMDKLRAGL